MSVKIKLTPDPPSWFDLNKYTSSHKADLKQWIWNFELRIEAWYMVTEGLEFSANGEPVPESVKLFNNVINACRCGFIVFQDGYQGLDDLPAEAVIMPMDAREFVGKDDPGFSAISVDLNAPVDLLIANFKRFVLKEKARQQVLKEQQARKKKPLELKGNVTVAKRQEWITNKILPCIDLILWMMLEGIIEGDNIYQEALTEWLDLSDSRKYRRAKEKAENCLSWEFLAYISAQQESGYNFLSKKQKIQQ